MYINILIFPIINFIILGLGTRWLGNYGGIIISIFTSSLTWLLSVYIFYEIIICHL